MPNRFTDEEPIRPEDQEPDYQENEDQGQEESGLIDRVLGEGKRKLGEKRDETENKIKDKATGKAQEKGKQAAKNALKKGAQKGAKVASKGKKVAKVLAKIPWPVLVYGIIIILIIIILVGLYSALTSLPKLIFGKIKAAIRSFVSKMWYLASGDILIYNDDVVKLANKLQGMGYDVQSYGFAIVSEYEDSDLSDDEHESKHGESTLQKGKSKQIKRISNSNRQNLKGYLAAETATYTEKQFSFSSDKSTHGLLDFDDANHFYVDKSGRLMTVEHSFLGWIDWGHVFSFDLTNWTAIYGRPMELFLALHLSTMMPEIPYQIATNDRFNTTVRIADQELEINYNNIYTEEELNGQVSPLLNLLTTAAGSDNGSVIEIVSLVNTEIEEDENPYAQVNDTVYFLNFFNLSQRISRNRNVSDYSVQIGDRTIELFDTLNDYVEPDMGKFQDPDGAAAYIGTAVSALREGEVEEKTIARLGFKEQFVYEEKELNVFYINFKYQDRDISFKLGFDNERYELLKDAFIGFNETQRYLNNIIALHFFGALFGPDAIKIEDNVPKEVWIFSKCLYIISCNNSGKEFTYQTSLEYFMKMLSGDIDELSTEVTFRNPYIREVVRHWYYKDIDFLGSKSNTPYGAYKLVPEDELSTYYKILIQEAISPTTPGTGDTRIFSDDDAKLLIQVCEPYINDDEPNDNIIELFKGGTRSNSFRGKYYRYDGSMETARKIEVARAIDFKWGISEENTKTITYAAAQGMGYPKKYYWNKGRKGWWIFKHDVKTLITAEDKEEYFKAKIVDGTIEYNGSDKDQIISEYQDSPMVRKEVNFNDTVDSEGNVRNTKNDAMNAFLILEEADTAPAQYALRCLKHLMVYLDYFTLDEMNWDEENVLLWPVDNGLPGDKTSWLAFNPDVRRADLEEGKGESNVDMDAYQMSVKYADGDVVAPGDGEIVDFDTIKAIAEQNDSEGGIEEFESMDTVIIKFAPLQQNAVDALNFRFGGETTYTVDGETKVYNKEFRGINVNTPVDLYMIIANFDISTTKSAGSMVERGEILGEKHEERPDPDDSSGGDEEDNGLIIKIIRSDGTFVEHPEDYIDPTYTKTDERMFGEEREKENEHGIKYNKRLREIA